MSISSAVVFVYWVIIVKDEICEIGIDEYGKCSNIWDMEKCPFTDDFKKQITEENRSVYIYKRNGMFIGEVDLVINMPEKGYTIFGERIYLSRLIVKKRIQKTGNRKSAYSICNQKGDTARIFGSFARSRL